MVAKTQLHVCSSSAIKNHHLYVMNDSRKEVMLFRKSSRIQKPSLLIVDIIIRLIGYASNAT